MSHPDIHKLLHNIANVWVKAELTAFDEYYAQDFSADYYGHKIDLSQLHERLCYVKQHQTERRLDIHEILHEENKAAIQATWYANDSTEGNVVVKIAAFYEFDADWKVRHIQAYCNQHVDLKISS
jgi:hypothetical protein